MTKIDVKLPTTEVMPKGGFSVIAEITRRQFFQ